MTPLPSFRRDQLNALDKESLITLILSMQEQIATMAAEIKGDMVKSCVWASGGFLGWRDFLGDLGSVLEDDSSHDIG